MTTPQNILNNIEYKLLCLLNLLKGNYEDEEEVDIMEMIRSIQIETTESSERIQHLEDKMNLIIKLLSK